MRIAIPGPGEVDIWLADLDGIVPDATVMDAAEAGRAAALRAPDLRRRFIASRGVLRGVLADYCGLAPGDLRFVREPLGRPALAPGPAGPHFSLSTSASLAAVAVAGAPVGVDVERPEAGLDGDLVSMAARIMSAKERTGFDTLPASARRAAFHALWTGKEAVLKAMGVGLSRDPSTLHLGWAEPSRISEDASAYDLARFDPGADAAGAVALEGRLTRVRLRPWRSGMEVRPHGSPPVAD